MATKKPVKRIASKKTDEVSDDLEVSEAYDVTLDAVDLIVQILRMPAVKSKMLIFVKDHSEYFEKAGE